MQYSKLQLAQAIAPALVKDHLNLIVLPTEKCNFRCTYCYEDFAIGKMPPHVVAALKAFMSKAAPRLKSLQLDWFGGEPLLAKQIMLDICTHARRLADEHGFASLSGSITTNGYLLDRELFATLLSLSQRHYQISLDGFGEGHDVTRRSASGKGTFERIWSNLLMMRESAEQFDVILRLHLTPQNGPTIKQLVDEICKEFAGDKRYTVFFKPIYNLGGPNGDTIRVISIGDVRTLTPRLISQLDSSGIRSYSDVGGPESSTGPVDEDVPYVCYASKANSLLIRSTGSVGKCTVALYDERNSVGKLLPNGEIELNSNINLWMRGLKSMDPTTLGCPLADLPEIATAGVRAEARTS